MHADGLAKVRSLAEIAGRIATRLEADEPVDPASLDVLVAQAEAARRLVVSGPARKQGKGSARSRIRRYLEERRGEVVCGEELAAVAGISEWARRVRELRAEGMEIEELGQSRYRLAR